VIIRFLVIGETAILFLLALLVVGLLRSHAEILQRLSHMGHADPDHDATPTGDEIAPGLAPLPSIDLQAARPQISSISGVTLDLERIEVPISGNGGYRLLAFLGTGCLSCLDFLTELRDGQPPAIPERVELLVITKDPAEENLARLREAGPFEVPVIMATPAWEQCGVPGSPYFVLLDGMTGTQIGGGSASRWDQVGSLLSDTLAEIDLGQELQRVDRRGRRRSRLGREEEELVRAGVSPDHGSLYAPVPFDAPHPESS